MDLLLGVIVEFDIAAHGAVGLRTRNGEAMGLEAIRFYTSADNALINPIAATAASMPSTTLR